MPSQPIYLAKELQGRTELRFTVSPDGGLTRLDVVLPITALGAPTPPTGLVAVYDEQTNVVSIDWDEVANVEYYVLSYRSGNGAWTELIKQQGSAGNVGQTGNLPGELLSYRVKSVRGMAESAWSDVVTLLVPGGPPVYTDIYENTY